jgi:hypothetical protein
MFKIEDVYVEDKNLALLLKAMAGIVRGQPRPVPMLNLEAQPNGTLKASADGTLMQVFAAHIAKAKLKEFGPKDVQDWLAKHGRSKLSANYVTKGLVKAGVLKRTGNTLNSRYVVQRAKR